MARHGHSGDHRSRSLREARRHPPAPVPADRAPPDTLLDRARPTLLLERPYRSAGPRWMAGAPRSSRQRTRCPSGHGTPPGSVSSARPPAHRNGVMHGAGCQPCPPVPTGRAGLAELQAGWPQAHILAVQGRGSGSRRLAGTPASTTSRRALGAPSGEPLNGRFPAHFSDNVNHYMLWCLQIQSGRFPGNCVSLCDTIVSPYIRQEPACLAL